MPPKTVYVGKRVNNSDMNRAPETGSLSGRVWAALFATPGEAVDMKAFMEEGKKTFASFSLSHVIDKLCDHYLIEVERVPEISRHHYRLTADMRGKEPIIFVKSNGA